MFRKSIFITLLTLTVLNLGSCKNSSENDNTQVNIENTVENKDSIQSKINKDNIRQEKKSSFTLSCGSGCAMIYNEQSRISNNSSYEIKFKVETYINDVISEENEEIYVFECNSIGKIKSIYLQGSQENILLNNNAVIKNDLIKIASTLCSQNTNSPDNSKIKLTEGNEPYEILTLPFDSKDFVEKRLNVKNKKYEASNYLIDYLIKKGYEGEEYGCYYLQYNNEITNIIVSISRADSEYFLLLKMDKKGILSYDEIGSIGGEDTLYFKISTGLVITTYNLNNVEVKKYKI